VLLAPVAGGQHLIDPVRPTTEDIVHSGPAAQAQQCLRFFPEPQGQGSLRPVLAGATTSMAFAFVSPV